MPAYCAGGTEVTIAPSAVHRIAFAVAHARPCDVGCADVGISSGPARRATACPIVATTLREP
jgi:hypothetical protein